MLRMERKRFTLPFVLPVAAFASVILIGTFLLWWEGCAAKDPVAFIDALFISTSSVCVTGLASVDPSTVFNRGGHVVMMILIQLGGLGITTYTTLIFYFWSRRISLTDRLAVGDALLHDPSFHLGKFLQRVVTTILALEALGALSLYCMESQRIGVFNAVFLAVSAFCNAGFALWPDNLIGWQQHLGVNVAVMSLIVCGGLGFAVVDECLRVGWARIADRRRASGEWAPGTIRFRSGLPAHSPLKLSRHSRLVLRASFWLILGGALLIMLTEHFANDADTASLGEQILPAFFQSVTARTAGFCTTDIARITDASLLALIVLMFIGGSPGSCAGGIKTTSFSVLLAFIRAQLRGRSQVVVAGRAVDTATLNKVFVLLTFALLTVMAATFILVYTEGGANHHGKTPFQVLDLLFEAVSAFATVGLSTNVSPQLSVAGKLIDCALMFIGRLGPIWLITTLQQFQTEPKYRLPEADLPIG